MRYKLIVYTLLALLGWAVFSSCATTGARTFYTDIPEETYHRIADQHDSFDDGWWQQGSIYFHEDSVWYGEIARVPDIPNIIKFRRGDIRKMFNHAQLKGFVYHMEKDYTFIFKDVDPRPMNVDVHILEVMHHGDITLYRQWNVSREFDAGSSFYSQYWLISRLYLEVDGQFIPWQSFKKDVLPLIEPDVYQNYVDIWGKKAVETITHQINLIQEHNENKLKKS